jgi:hypothetical protein
MKRLLKFFCVVFLFIPLFSEPNYPIENKLDSVIVAQNKINNLQNSEIEKIKKDFTLNNSLFNNQLLIFSSIMAFLWASFIFILGFIIPNRQKTIYLQRINEQEKLIKETKNQLEKFDNVTRFNISRAIYTNYQHENNFESFIWSLRVLKYYYDNDFSDEFDIFKGFIKTVKDHSRTIDSDPILRKFDKEVNDLIFDIKNNLKSEDELKTLEEIRVNFNKVCWSDLPNVKKEK